MRVLFTLLLLLQIGFGAQMTAILMDETGTTKIKEVTCDPEIEVGCNTPLELNAGDEKKGNNYILNLENIKEESDWTQKTYILLENKEEFSLRVSVDTGSPQKDKDGKSIGRRVMIGSAADEYTFYTTLTDFYGACEYIPAKFNPNYGYPISSAFFTNPRINFTIPPKQTYYLVLKTMINYGDNEGFAKQCSVTPNKILDDLPISSVYGIKISTTAGTDTTDYANGTGDGLGNAATLPLVLIGERVEMDLMTAGRQRVLDRDFYCIGKEGTKLETSNDKLESARLLDRNGKLVIDLLKENKITDGRKLDFVMPNGDFNYKQMKIELVCKTGQSHASETDRQTFYIEARPAKIYKASQAINSGENADKLYVGYSYGLEDNNNESLNHLQKVKNQHNPNILLEGLDTNKKHGENVVHYDGQSYNEKQVFIAQDKNNNEVTTYTSQMNIVIAGQLTKNGGIANDCIEENLCKMGYLDLTNGSNTKNTGVKGIYTSFGKRHTLEYENLGKTQIFGVDDSWTAYSQRANSSSSKICEKDSFSNDRSKSKDNLLGCNIGLTATTGDPDLKEEILFYEFQPAVMKIQLQMENSPENTSYGVSNLTFMRELKTDDITNKDYEFETAKVSAKIIAISASKSDFENNVPITQYDGTGELYLAKVTFTGSPANPAIQYDMTTKVTPANPMALKISVDADKTGVTENPVPLKDAQIIENKVSYNEKNKNENIKLLSQSDIKAGTIDTSKPVVDYIDSYREANTFKAGVSEFVYYVNLNPKNSDISKTEKLHAGNLDIAGGQAFQDQDQAGKPKDTWKKLLDDHISVALEQIGDATLVNATSFSPTPLARVKGEELRTATYLGVDCSKADDCSALASNLGKDVPGYADNKHRAMTGITFFGEQATATSNDQLFDYRNNQKVSFTMHDDGKGADMINIAGDSKTEVRAYLRGQGDTATPEQKALAQKYCDLFEYCRKFTDNLGLGDGDLYGFPIIINEITQNKWHGSGNEGATIADPRERLSRQTPPRINR